ncbi:MAG: LCP family protein [Candidatus Atribacteria bacterium]|nr:LCP family protein [Candidatus Atribacteria bacterium]MCK4308753.1 LCP family protein [Candidatus Atribacteria bacterium]
MYENNLLEEKTGRNSGRRLKRKKNKKIILIISSILLLSILIIFLKYLGIFPFSSNILSYNRINVLIVGCDEIKNHGRADTIVFLSISPKTKDALILSIPRDTRVEIPGRGMDKINHAYAFGGEKLISETVNSFLDVPLHFYAVVDFEGFVSIIDGLGGVEIDIEKEMHYVDKAGGVDINLYPGKQILNGEKALEYIRFRYDKLGDLGRIKRQQKLAVALIKKMMNFDSIIKIPQLLEGIKEYIATNIKVQDVIALANLFKGVNQEKFRIETVHGKPVYIEGVSYLKPDVEEVQQRVKSLIYGKNSGVKVEVLNGNGMAGVAHKIAKELELQGFEVVNIANADNFDYQKTRIIVYSKKVNLDNEFKRLFNDFEIVKRYQTQDGLDLVIILGKDMIN